MYIASENPHKIVKSSLMGGNFDMILDAGNIGAVGALAIDRDKQLLYFSDSVKLALFCLHFVLAFLSSVNNFSFICLDN